MLYLLPNANFLTFSSVEEMDTAFKAGEISAETINNSAIIQGEEVKIGVSLQVEQPPKKRRGRKKKSETQEVPAAPTVEDEVPTKTEPKKTPDKKKKSPAQEAKDKQEEAPTPPEIDLDPDEDEPIFEGFPPDFNEE